MRIQSTHRLAVSQPSADDNRLKELWRDHGVNPVAMTRRAFWERPMKDGEPLQGGRKADPMVTDSLERRLGGFLDGSLEIEQLEKNLASFAREYGLALSLEKGIPQVNWDADRPGVLDFRHSGGPPAYHELVHVFQCLIGGAAAVGTAAAHEYAEKTGRPADSVEQLGPTIQSLSPEEKARAFETMVKPMETQAYSSFEESAFYATGLMGKRSKNKELFRERLKETVKAYAQAYETASAPKLETNLESEIYGGIGHLARTNGETALVLGAAGIGYYQLARQAMKIHPLMAVPVASPLVYLLYRSMVSG